VIATRRFRAWDLRGRYRDRRVPAEAAAETPIGESRWPPRAALIACAAALGGRSSSTIHLVFTNSTPFSSTDVIGLTHRAKYATLVQSTVELALFGLIVARAVNAFT
jgi:hypothetical protein